MLVKQIARLMEARQGVRIVHLSEDDSGQSALFASPDKIPESFMDLEVFLISAEEMELRRPPNREFKRVSLITLHVGKAEVGECT